MPLSIKVNLRVTGHCNQGGRRYMEDMFSVAYQQTSDDKDLEYAFFGIFDGHGGGEAATFAKEHLMDIIVKQRNFWSDKDEDVLRAIRDGYVNTHYAMWRELDKWPRTASGLPSTAGTTASVAFIRKGKIYIGHVGDSGIILGYQDEGDPHWKAKALTRDHKPESGPEMMRIQESGGKVVSKSGVPRVVWNRPRIGHKGPVRRSTHIDEIPFLAVARSLGDLWSYNSELDTFVVSPEPDVKVVTVDLKSHRCLIFGTDGLWNMLTPQAAVAIVQAAERHNEKHLIASQQTGSGQADVQMWINPSKSLVDRALERWSSTRLRADNTSVVTLMLDPPGPSRSEVLMSRKNERVPSPKSVPTAPFGANSINTPMDQVPKPSSPLTTLLPRDAENAKPNNPDTFRSAHVDVRMNAYQENATEETAKIDCEKAHDDGFSQSSSTTEDLKAADENLEKLVVPPSPNLENIQVAEISSSNATEDLNESRIDESASEIEETSTDLLNAENHDRSTDAKSPENCSKIDEKPTVIPPVTTNEKCESTPIENVSGNSLVRQKAFCGSCQESTSKPRLRRTGSALTSESKHDQQNSMLPVVLPSLPSRRQSQGSSLGSHLEARTMRRRRSVNTPTKCLGDRQKSYFTSVGSRLKRDAGLGLSRDRTIDSLQARSPSSAERITIVGSKRRYSSTSEPVEETNCGNKQEPTVKRRTRSEDRPVLVDENVPENKGKQQSQQRHNRLRWPDKQGMSSRSRSGSITGPGTVVTQDKISTPNSFQRRSLEKKATPVKTIRRPSINGSSRVQLRGSFALRDWDATKSGHRGSCSDRLNRTVGSVIGSSDSSPAPSLQRWLRSDTLAATPVKTLRSRNVDITGHTVPAQIAHQYGVVKPNRLSLPAKIKLTAKVSKSSNPTLATSKLTKQSPGGSGNVSTSSSTGSSSGITKRVKSPYNPSARSALGTRSRLKRLGK